MDLRRLAFPVALIALLATAGPAAGATHHAAPDSERTSLPCAEATPCKLDYAMLVASTGDDVALAPGDYYSSGTTPWAGVPDVRSGVAVHGTPGRPLPVLHGHVFTSTQPFIALRSGGTLSDVTLDVEPEPGLAGARAADVEGGAMLDRSIVRARGATGAAMTACAMLGGTVRNTACLGSGDGTVHAIMGTGSGTATYAVRNVTAITKAAAGDGLRVLASSNTATMTVANTIARGTTSDIVARAGLGTGRVTVNIDHSNWSAQSTGGNGVTTIASGAGNQHGPTFATPVFADAAGGDYRPLPTSPTIDAGANDFLNGPLALGGDVRTIGAVSDIGAYEVEAAPPPPPAPPATPDVPFPADQPVPDFSGGEPFPESSEGNFAFSEDFEAPVIRGLTVRKLSRTSKARAIRFRLSEPAEVALVISRPATERAEAKELAVIKVERGAGPNVVRLNRKPGRYEVTAVAVDVAGNTSDEQTKRFTITKPKPKRKRPKRS
ncbi:MAG: hypothetical protein ACEQSX_02350 [Baekduiaceae bacterium]